MSTLIPRSGTSVPWVQVISAGEYLKSHFGEKMSVIAMGGYKLESLRDGPYPVPESNRSIDYQLAQSRDGAALVKSRKFVGEWWAHNETDPEGIWLKPSEQFDYYFFIRESKAATPWQYVQGMD